MLKFRIVECIEDFENLRSNWDDVFKNDTKATVFQSWSWLRGWIEVIGGNWLIISVHLESESRYIAFLPLYKDSQPGLFGIRNYSTLKMAGEPLADYSGMLCLPQYENEVIEKIATYLSDKMRWNRFNMRNISDTRIIQIARRIALKKYDVQYGRKTPCPRLNLPDSWEQYVAEILDPKYSKKLKSKLKKAEKRGLYTSGVNDENLELYLQHFLKLHEMRWGLMDEQKKQLFTSTFKWLYLANLLRMDVLWYDNKPIAIQVSFMDRRKKIFLFYNGGWDSDYAHLSPGIVLHGHCINYAIENGYKVYDFMRGGESYKYLFGAVNKYNRNIVITANTLESILRKIKARMIGSTSKA